MEVLGARLEPSDEVELETEKEVLAGGRRLGRGPLEGMRRVLVVLGVVRGWDDGAGRGCGGISLLAGFGVGSFSISIEKEASLD